MSGTPSLKQAIEAALGRVPVRLSPLGSGASGDVTLVEFGPGEALVAKVGESLALEARMLSWLAEHTALPVPTVIHATKTLLLMSRIPVDGSLNAAAQDHAAELIAALHTITAPAFGFAFDTLIGGLPQPNPPSPDWIPFFAEQRLLFMGEQAVAAGRLAGGTLRRIERLAGRLERWLTEPEAPGLIHGDLWSGNILCRQGRISGFIDPAIYFADPEIELAFGTLFGSLGEPFFRRYQALRPLRPGFFEERRDLYNLYPLLVHVRLFGGSYVGSVEASLRRYGV